ncbi:hypothetical protein EZV62_015063 [Acer yangbiense]|uniref:Uncharacterized protein n=1 Tax=Acer yangbiense TaxID=1000413 RepID=A0A5C7HU85_9ROSI|nr:hypothetical protein EZV62_015063 [Acer yangbiense]
MKLPRTVTVFHLPESSVMEEPIVHVVIPEYGPDTETWMTPIMRFLRDGTLPDERNASLRLDIPTMRVSYYNPGDNDEELRGFLEEIDERRDQARIRTAYHQTRIARYYNTKVRSRSFLPGDLIFKKVIPAPGYHRLAVWETAGKALI